MTINIDILYIYIYYYLFKQNRATLHNTTSKLDSLIGFTACSTVQTSATMYLLLLQHTRP